MMALLGRAGTQIRRSWNTLATARKTRESRQFELRYDVQRHGIAV